MKTLKNSLILVTLLGAVQPALAEGTNNSGTANNTTGKAANMNSNNSTVNTSSNWSSENSYWRSNYSKRPYYSSSRNYSMYEPAYRYGVDLYNQNPGKSYDQLDQSQLSSGWSNARAESNLDWDDAQQATRDAYNRMYENSNSTTSTTR